MITILSVTVLVTAAAIVVLFAMHAELNSRLSAASPTNPSVQRLDMAPRRPLRWPSSLNNLARSERSVALVLSPICASCVGVAASLNSLSTEGGLVRIFNSGCWSQLQILIAVRRLCETTSCRGWNSLLMSEETGCARTCGFRPALQPYFLGGENLRMLAAFQIWTR